MFRNFAPFLVFFAALSSAQNPREFQTIVQFNELEYSYPTPEDRNYAEQNGLFVRGNGVPIDVDVHYGANQNSRIFVTVPRFTTGIPFTVGVVNQRRGVSTLVAYPNYAMHSSHGRDCNGITSVFRVAIDECQRLYILDTGMIGSMQYCSPQLLIYNLLTDTMIHRYRFPDGQFKPGISLFTTSVVDVRDPPPQGQCRDTKVYIADITGFAVIVYDSQTDSSWRVQNKHFYPYPSSGTHTVAGESFEFMDGIIGMSVTPRQLAQTGGGGNTGYGGNRHRPRPRPNNGKKRGSSGGERQLYWHALASHVENAVPLRILDNQTLWTSNPDAVPEAFTVLGRRATQSAAEAIDSNGNMFFGQNDPVSIACWNINTPYAGDNIRYVAINNATLQFASGIKVKRNKINEEELWVSTNRFQRIMAGTKNSNEVNFRIQVVKLNDLLQGQSTCAGAAHIHQNAIVYPRN